VRTRDPFVPLGFLREALGEQRFAELYAEAQDVAYKVTAGDWEGLEPSWR
jgi:hypothetical protein